MYPRNKILTTFVVTRCEIAVLSFQRIRGFGRRRSLESAAGQQLEAGNPATNYGDGFMNDRDTQREGGRQTERRRLAHACGSDEIARRRTGERRRAYSRKENIASPRPPLLTFPPPAARFRSHLPATGLK